MLLVKIMLYISSHSSLEGFRTYCSSCCFKSISAFRSKTKVSFDNNGVIIYISQHEEENRINR